MTKTTRFTTLWLAAVLMVAMAGCATAPQVPGRDDTDVAKDVRARIADALGSRSSEVEVSVESGIVTLSGSVGSDADRRRAADAARTVDGVKSVINNLQLP